MAAQHRPANAGRPATASLRAPNDSAASGGAGAAALIAGSENDGWRHGRRPAVASAARTLARWVYSHPLARNPDNGCFRHPMVAVVTRWFSASVHSFTPDSCPEPPVFGHTRYDSQANRLLAETIVKLGGMMVTVRAGVQYHQVGHIAWLGEQHCFWLEVKATHDVLPRVFEYDEFCRVGHRGVAFFHREEIVAYVCTRQSAPAPEHAAEPVHAAWGDPLGPPPRDTICTWCEQWQARVGGQRTCAWHLPRCAPPTNAAPPPRCG